MDQLILKRFGELHLPNLQETSDLLPGLMGLFTGPYLVHFLLVS